MYFDPINVEEAKLYCDFVMKLAQMRQARWQAMADSSLEIEEEKPAAKKSGAPTAGTPTETAPVEATPTPVPAASPSESKLTLEQVRAKLTAISQAGKAAEVKALLKEFGVAKLTDVPPEKFPEILSKAEAL